MTNESQPNSQELGPITDADPAACNELTGAWLPWKKSRREKEMEERIRALEAEVANWVVKYNRESRVSADHATDLRHRADRAEAREKELESERDAQAAWIRQAREREAD